VSAGPDLEVETRVGVPELGEEGDVDQRVLVADDQVEWGFDLVEPAWCFGREHDPGEGFAERFPGVLDGISRKCSGQIGTKVAGESSRGAAVALTEPGAGEFGPAGVETEEPRQGPEVREVVSCGVVVAIDRRSEAHDPGDEAGVTNGEAKGDEGADRMADDKGRLIVDVESVQGGGDGVGVVVGTVPPGRSGGAPEAQEVGDDEAGMGREGVVFGAPEPSGTGQAV